MTDDGGVDRRKRALTVAIALVVVLSAVPLAVAIPQPGGTVGIAQSVTPGTIQPGTTVTVETTVNAEGYNAPALAADLPAGWTVESQSADGPATFKPSTNEWVWLSGGEYTVVYTVAVPADATDGGYALASTASAIDPADGAVVQNGASTTVDVQTEPQNQPPAADAGADQTVEGGATVTLDSTGTVDPDGDDVDYAWTQTGGPPVSLDDAAAAQPTFVAPDVSSPTTLTFEVAVADGEGGTDVDAVVVTVQDDDDPSEPADVSIGQSVTSGTVQPGSTVTVEATVDATGLNSPALAVDLPAGWSIQSQSADGPATFKPSTNEWVWLSGGAYTVTYTVAVPADATDGQYPVEATASAIDPASDGFATDEDSVTVTVQDEGTGPAEASSAVSLSPSSATVAVGNEQTFDVVVESADGGVGAYSATVSVDDPETATITDVELHGGPGAGTSDVVLAAEGSSATIDAALMDTADGGSVTIATVTVEGAAEGETDLALDVAALGNEDGHGYDVTGESGASLSVRSIGPVGDFDQPPTDPDGDGHYEDVNGDGAFDVVDVQALFANVDDGTVQSNADAFDFNDDGTVDVVDVQALFAELQP